MEDNGKVVQCMFKILHSPEPSEYAGIDVSLILRCGMWTRLCLVKRVLLSPAIESSGES